MFGEQIEIVLVEPHAMSRGKARPEHAKVGKIADRGPLIDLPGDDGLQPGLRDMHVDWKFMAVRDVHAVAQETLGAVMRNRRRDGDLHACQAFSFARRRSLRQPQ